MFLIDVLTTNNTIYRDSLTLSKAKFVLKRFQIFIKAILDLFLTMFFASLTSGDEASQFLAIFLLFLPKRNRNRKFLTRFRKNKFE